MLLAALNTEIFKYMIVLCAAPLWLPFLKALLAELDDALAAEGGLFGRPPSRKELAFIERDPNRAKSPLVSLEFDPGSAQGKDRGQSSRRPAPASARSSAPAPAPAPSARGGLAAQGGFAKPRAVRGFARKDQRGK